MKSKEGHKNYITSAPNIHGADVWSIIKPWYLTQGVKDSSHIHTRNGLVGSF